MEAITELTINSPLTGSERLDYRIILTNSREYVTIQIEDINRQYFNSFKNRIGPVLNNIISNLIRSKDYLGLQLNFEFGNISEKQFEQLELEFVNEPQDLDPNTLSTDIEMIMKLSNKILNSEEISTMFNCSIEDAEKALDKILLLKEN